MQIRRRSDEELSIAAGQVAARIGKLTAEMDAALNQRRDLIEGMRLNDWGYDRIAQALGIMKARAQQLVKFPALQKPLADQIALDGAAELELRETLCVFR